MKKLIVGLIALSTLSVSGCSIQNTMTKPKDATNERLCEMAGYYSQRDNFKAYDEVSNEMDNRPLHAQYFISQECTDARLRGIAHYNKLDDAGKVAGIALAVVAVVGVAVAASQGSDSGGGGSTPSQEYDCTEDLFGTLTCKESK